jgi:GT2 family glycosyltransferase
VVADGLAVTERDDPQPGESELDALRRENARLRDRASGAERRLQRVETELREIKQSGALRIGRFISRLLPGGLKHRLYDPFRRAESPSAAATVPAEPPPTSDAPEGPIRFSIIVPVHDHARHLPAMIDSLLAQTRAADQILLVDDASPDPAVREILDRYAGRAGVEVLRNESNRGISRTTNRGISHATGTHLAFVDCDDLLEPDALAQVEEFLSSHPGAGFVYSDRIDIDDAGHELQRWAFADRAARPPVPELLEGMFTSHLKVVSAAAFRDVGLFRPRYDLTQDYDLALRLAERRQLGHLPAAVYRHRIHGTQQSQQQQRRQEQVLERIRSDSVRRSRLRNRTEAPLVSVVVEGSAPAGAAPRLKALEGRFEPSAPGKERGEYVLRLPAGAVLADPGLLAKMIERLEQAPELSACCALVTDGDRVVSNGGRLVEANGVLTVTLDDHTRDAAALALLEERRCDWLPAGATLWRGHVAARHRPDPGLAPALREVELGLRLRRERLEVGTCPSARVHWKVPLPAEDPVQLLDSLRSIFRSHGVVVQDEALYRALGWDPMDFAAARARIARPT